MTPNQLQKKLERNWEAFTVAEQKIATYLIRHRDAIPFETASSLSGKVGVSPMTVSRFMRRIGYQGIAGLKEALHTDSGWQRVYASRSATDGDSWVSRSLNAEIRSLKNVHSMVDSTEWHSVIRKIVTAKSVVIPSIRQTAPMATVLVHHLQQVRANVRLADGSDGAYIDALLDAGFSDCLILIDFERYFRNFRKLAEEAAHRKIAFVMITDDRCHWARSLSSDVLMIDSDRVWHSYTSIFALISLLVEAVMNESDGARERIGKIVALRNGFEHYDDADASAKIRPRLERGRQRPKEKRSR